MNFNVSTLNVFKYVKIMRISFFTLGNTNILQHCTRRHHKHQFSYANHIYDQTHIHTSIGTVNGDASVYLCMCVYECVFLFVCWVSKKVKIGR